MPDDNKHNLLYFEAPSMRELSDQMETWQNEQGKRLLSVSVERDAGKFCCIALSNPIQVLIVDGNHNPVSFVYSRGANCLAVYNQE